MSHERGTLPGHWPFLTESIPAVPGTIKVRYEDFRVDEIPAYEAVGQGDHVFFRIEKTGLTTFQAILDVARRLEVDPRSIGSAGLKDARAVTTQTLSVEHVPPERVLALDIPRIRITEARRHPKKIRIGHHRGNRFRIKLRPPSMGAEESNDLRLARARSVIETLSRRGVPNYFGPQRFGIRGDTGEIGRELLGERYDEAAALIAGSPGPLDSGDHRRARELFAAGRWGEAADAWPRGFREAARLSRAMERSGGDARRAVLSLGRRMLSFYVSAYQSWLFNDVLAARLGELDRVREGDLAYRHDSGAIFEVEDAAAEQPRVDRLEISATGPLFGRRMGQPQGHARELEESVLRSASVEPRQIVGAGPFAPSGSRRPLRVPLADAGVEPGRDELGEWIELRFALPPGSYATSVLGEVAKEGLRTGTAEDFLEGELPTG